MPAFGQSRLRRAVGWFLEPWHDWRRSREVRGARRRVFVDCGANTCQVLRKFLRKLPDFEFFAFEAQPELAEAGAQVVREHPQRQITFYNQAVWTKDETLDFFLATAWGPNYRGGSTLMSGNTRNKSQIDYAQPVQVPAIDFSQWLARTVVEDDYVIVKMDIEGAEYDVLEKVFADGHERLIDELIVEFHQNMNDALSRDRHNALVKRLRGALRLHVWH
jgi:FkbM family methyltransferase